MNIYIKILMCAVSAYAVFMILQFNSLQSRLEARDAEIEELKQCQVKIYHLLDEERNNRRNADIILRRDVNKVMSGVIYRCTRED